MSVRTSDRRLVLWLGAAVLVLIVAVSIWSPQHVDDDPRPRVDNNGTKGAKAAFLLLPRLGYKVQRWEKSEDALDELDATKTTFVMADLFVEEKEQKSLTQAMQRFLDRGGRVLETGSGTVLPEGGTTMGPNSALCYTTPEGQGPLARAGQLAMSALGAWDEKNTGLGAALRVEQRCGGDAVVVRYRVGKGEAIWWASATPLTNQGLRDDGNLRLLLASVGKPGRTVVFDEMVHGERQDRWAAAKGLPLKWLMVQMALIVFVLLLSFSRRRGPVRLPVMVPRSSPVEFAESMGHLYQTAGRTEAATGMARRRLLRVLENDCGVPKQALGDGPDAIVAALNDRLGGDWSLLGKHMKQAELADRGEWSQKNTLQLVQALDDDIERLEAVVAPKRLAAARARAPKEIETETVETSLLARLGKEK